MDNITRMREEARECERIAFLEREQAKVDRMIAREEERRLQIAKRLETELKRLNSLRSIR